MSDLHLLRMMQLTLVMGVQRATDTHSPAAAAVLKITPRGSDLRDDEKYEPPASEMSCVKDSLPLERHQIVAITNATAAASMSDSQAHQAVDSAMSPCVVVGGEQRQWD